MHEIYISSKCDIEKFLNTKIHPRTQNTALFNASKYRYEGIGQITPCYPSEVMHLIDSLGKITAYIQSAYNDASTLKTTEKGRFKVNYLTMKNKTDREKLQNILRELRDCHYIRIIGEVDDENEIIFRLHKLFAPYFKFSYRGAYSNITINGEDLLKLCAEKDIKDQDKIIKKIVGEIVKIEKISTLDLWFEEKND
jgi:putative lipoic acid-binding regulatory protein